MLAALAGPLVLATAGIALADEAPRIDVTGAWSRATAPGARVGVVYMTIDTRGDADRLVALESAVAERAEIHEMHEEGGAMRMRKAGPPFDLDNAAPLVLEPGGLHVMLMGLTQPLVAGTSHTLTLVFENAGRVPVEVAVRSPSGD